MLVILDCKVLIDVKSDHLIVLDVFDEELKGIFEIGEYSECDYGLENTEDNSNNTWISVDYDLTNILYGVK